MLSKMRRRMHERSGAFRVNERSFFFFISLFFFFLFGCFCAPVGVCFGAALAAPLAAVASPGGVSGGELDAGAVTPPLDRNLNRFKTRLDSVLRVQD